MNCKSSVVLLLGLLFVVPLAKAQDNDFGLSLGAELSKKFTKKFEVQLEEEVRLNQNVSEFDRAMTTLGASYSLNKTFKAGAFYTWIYANNQQDDYYENRHRLGAWLQAGHKFGRLKVSLREKFLTTYRDEDLGNYKYNPKSYLRSKLEVAYNIPNFPVNPYASVEMHYQVNNPKGNEIDKWRYTAGLEYNISKKFAIDLFYRYDNEVNVKNPVNSSKLGVMAKFQL
jgi:Protein of unknown function (DUF2490).